VGDFRGLLPSVTFAPEAADLPAFAGDYRSSEIEASYLVVATKSGLTIQPPGVSEVLLKPLGKDMFVGPAVLKFFRDSGGQVAGFTMNRHDLRGLPFNRLQRAN